LRGTSAWILVLDVKAREGTRELVEQIITVRLDRVVNHRRIIPADAEGIEIHAEVIRKSTGFEVGHGTITAGQRLRLRITTVDGTGPSWATGIARQKAACCGCR
jgi:hypothetical protein